ncbi:MAG: TonB family protein [Paraburkholderia sp.]|uniref:TonB family protein n=1 Tax=Paraburkholderia sp. TaxID=1926495 RepID=UPI00120E7F21|nr:TonB family protein [Paraburkholderia sp.]TAM08481.1 MAG: TonB family protein [Paraburkholderia sp.]TAM30220.1 MAG: TonB family protein [Paraburkholderia sp.]
MSKPLSLTSPGLPVQVRHDGQKQYAQLNQRPRQKRHIVGAAVFVGALHVALLGLVMSAREPQREAMPVRVVAAELITSAPAASAMPAPAVPLRPQPPAPARQTSAPRPVVQPVAHAAAPVVHQRVTEPQQQPLPAAAPAAPAVAPAPPTSSASSASSAQQADASPAAAQAAADGDPTPRAVAQLDCTIAKPAYPMLSRRSRESGTALVQLRVDVKGHVDAAHVVASSGYPRLDAAALDAVLASACAPYREHGKAVPATAKVPVVFNLSE